MNENYNLYKNLTTAELNSYAQNMIEITKSLALLTDDNGEPFKNIDAAKSKHKDLVYAWTCNAYIYFSAVFYKSANIQSQLEDLRIFDIRNDIEDIVMNVIVDKLSKKDGVLHPRKETFTKAYFNTCAKNLWKDFYKVYIRKPTIDETKAYLASKSNNKNPTFVSTDEEFFDENGRAFTRGDIIPDLDTTETIYIKEREEKEFMQKNYIGNYLCYVAEKGDIDLIMVVLSFLSKEDIISSIDKVKSANDLVFLMNRQAEKINDELFQNISVSKIMRLMPASTATSLLLSNADVNSKADCIKNKTEAFKTDMKKILKFKPRRKKRKF